MKKTILLASTAMLLMIISSCGKVKTGNVTFWQQSGSGYGVTVVSLNSVTSNITSEYASAPACGQAGCAVFNGIEEGTYTYSASDGTSNWNGSITISEGCKTMQLY
jgi:hypothetical protein